MMLPSGRALYIALALLALAIAALANAHLVMVAGTTQPPCVKHNKPGEAAGGFGAAGSTC